MQAVGAIVGITDDIRPFHFVRRRIELYRQRIVGAVLPVRRGGGAVGRPGSEMEVSIKSGSKQGMGIIARPFQLLRQSGIDLPKGGDG
jgi:hypothetical protein